MAKAPIDSAARGAVVTGAASGVGRATALALARNGHGVVIADLNEAGARETIALAEGEGLDPAALAFHRTDVSEEADVHGAVAQAVSRFGGLACMVNNAGVGGAFGPITELEVEDWDYTFAVLVRGVFLGIKHAARAFAAGGSGGAIVNVASVAAYSGGFGPQAYSAAKAAVVNLTLSAAVELAPAGVRVNGVAPGAILTPLVHGGREEHTARTFEQVQPWPEHGRPEDIAQAIVYLAGPEARFVSGETISVDGGLTAAGPGADFFSRLGNDPRARGLVGVNRGTSGLASEVRRTVEPSEGMRGPPGG